MLNAQFLLSIYCLQQLYLVMPRRWTGDQWLSWSLRWPGQCLLCPLQHMSQSFSLSKVSLVLHHLPFFLICILYFVICFQTVSQILADAPGTPWGGLTGHRTHCAAWHASQVTCHSQALVILFHFISTYVNIVFSWLTMWLTAVSLQCPCAQYPFHI